MQDVVTIPIYAVPKILHVTYSSLDQLPTELRDNLHAWQNLGWDVHFHSHDDNLTLISTWYSKFMPLYKALTQEQQDIFVRYVYLHKYGGLACDLSYKPLKDIYSQIQSEVLCFYSNTFRDYLTTDMFGGSAGHPFWMDVMNSCVATAPFWAFIDPIKTSFCVGSYVLSGVAKRSKHPIRYAPLDWLPSSACDSVHSDGSAFSKSKSKEDDIWVGVYCYRKQLAIGLATFVGLIVCLLFLNIGGTTSTKLVKRNYF